MTLEMRLKLIYEKYSYKGRSKKKDTMALLIAEHYVYFSVLDTSFTSGPVLPPFTFVLSTRSFHNSRRPSSQFWFL